MSAKKRSREEWLDLYQEIQEAIARGDIEPTILAAAQHFGIKYSTLQTALMRLGVCAEDLKNFSPFEEKDKSEVPPPRGQVREDKGNNTWFIDANHPRIVTLEQLLKFCKVDLRVWEVEHHVVNKWEVGAKDMSKELVIKALIQVKAWLRRKKLKPLFPTLQPLVVSAKIPKPRETQRKGIYRSLMVADLQAGFKKNVHTGELIPFHDRRVLDLALQLLQYEKFDDVTFLGDGLDLSEWTTKFIVEPEFMFTTMPALIEFRWWLEQVRLIVPNAQIDLMQGNHDRIKKAIMSHFRAAYDLRPADELELPPSLSVERLLGLHSLHIGYIANYPDGKKWLTDRFFCQHGKIARGGSGDTAKAVVGKYKMTVAFGHAHRQEMVALKDVGREGHVVHRAFCPGCACKIDGSVPGSSEDHQWQQGIGVVEYIPDRPEINPNIKPILIDEGTMIYDGQIFTARDRDEEIDEMLGIKLEKLGQEKENSV